MISRFISAILFFILFHVSLQAQLVGLWRTVGDIDKTEKSIIEIYEHEGKLFGKVIKLLPAATHTICEKCPGDLKGKPITGMVILRDLTQTNKGAENGRVLDPSSGKTYQCYIELEEADVLKLRGYIGSPAFGRTQYWYRVKS